jgi:hypothetical protein
VVSHAAGTPMEAVRPGTNGYSVLTNVCTSRYGTEHIADPIAHAAGVLPRK